MRFKKPLTVEELGDVQLPKFRNDLDSVLRAENKHPDLALHEVHDLRTALLAKTNLSPEDTIALLRARIAELEWIASHADGVIHAASEHIKTLSNQIEQRKIEDGLYDYAKGM